MTWPKHRNIGVAARWDHRKALLLVKYRGGRSQKALLVKYWKVRVQKALLVKCRKVRVREFFL